LVCGNPILSINGPSFHFNTPSRRLVTPGVNKPPGLAMNTDRP
jgi:hypothetical protein